MHLRLEVVTVGIFLILSGLPSGLLAQETARASTVPWEVGPGVGTLGDQAHIDIPEGYQFTGKKGTEAFMEETGNLVSGQELGVLANKKEGWFAVFEYTDSGYIPDTEKNSLDADAMLKSIQKNTSDGNEERKKRGWGTLTVLDWIQPPRYSPETHNLEWSTRAQTDDQHLVANHNTRYLGRYGVISVTLVADPEQLTSVLPVYQGVMRKFSYNPNTSYSAFVKGDKVAEYGLTALVVGGAAAAAAKGGLFKGLWKLLVAGLFGLGALAKRIFGGKSAENTEAG